MRETYVVWNGAEICVDSLICAQFHHFND
jgi:hypothetical protein